MNASPALAFYAPITFPSPLNHDQRRFLAAHMQYPMQWRWHFKDTLMRVTTIAGEVASIWKMDLDDLVRAGLLAPGVGYSYRITEKGRTYVG
jgi:hypothetical protein